MDQHGLSSNKLASELKVPASAVAAIVRRQRAVSAEMALRLSHYFATTAQLWQKLQMQYGLELASQKLGKRIERGITPLPQTNSGVLRAS